MQIRFAFREKKTVEKLIMSKKNGLCKKLIVVLLELKFIFL